MQHRIENERDFSIYKKDIENLAEETGDNVLFVSKSTGKLTERIGVVTCAKSKNEKGTLFLIRSLDGHLNYEATDPSKVSSFLNSHGYEKLTGKELTIKFNSY